MFTNPKIRIILAAGAVLLALAVGLQLVKGNAQAQLQAQSGDPPGMTIPYAGQLTGDDGTPVTDGTYDFVFTLYDEEEGGNLLWSETQTDVRVSDGRFAVMLGSVNLLPGASKEATSWLQVSVRGAMDQDFAVLAPRQKLGAEAADAPTSPSAVGTCPHNHFGEFWQGPSTEFGLNITNLGPGDGIRAFSNATGYTYAAFYGYNTGSGTGVYGQSTTGRGVHAESGSGNGLYAKSTSGDAINATTDATGAHSVIFAHAVNVTGLTSRSDNFNGLVAGGNDTSSSDLYGDIYLEGNYGEIITTGNLDLYTDGFANLYLDRNDNENACFYIINSADTIVASVCENGTKSAVLQTQDDGQRAVYTMESPEVWLEDLGSAALVNGEATVTLEPIFAETVNTNVEYHVFVTPLCQAPVILFVTSKTSTGFTVQGVTLDGSPSDCSFDYRITAKRLGLENLRLEPVLNPEDTP